MSAPKFASITASLLARKGEASPSTFEGPPGAEILWSSLHREAPQSSSAMRRNEHVRAAIVHEQPALDVEHFSEGGGERRAFGAEAGERRHRISLALSAQEHEKLGIVAVKRGMTRHQLMRDALDAYFEKLASEYRSDCACIATGGCRNGCID
jgi:hypothetical protein